MIDNDRCCPRTTRHTTHLHDLPECITITRRKHPLENQSLQVLGQLTRRGDQYLLVILPDQSRSLVPIEWTSAASVKAGANTTETLGSFDDLLNAKTLADAFLQRAAANRIARPVESERMAA